MKNVKHTPYPTNRADVKKTKAFAVHQVNPAGTKVGKKIQKARGVPKDERGGVVFRSR